MLHRVRGKFIVGSRMHIFLGVSSSLEEFENHLRGGVGVVSYFGRSQKPPEEGPPSSFGLGHLAIGARPHQFPALRPL